MDRSLYQLIQAIVTAPTEQALRLQFMDRVSECFGVQRWGIYLFDSDNLPTSIDVSGVSDTFVEQYQRFGKSVDPVLRYVMQYHAPAYEELVLPPGTWKQSELYKRCCSTYDHEHIMTGPIVGQGQLIGTLNFARIANTPTFNRFDLASFSAICAHFSVSLARLRDRSTANPNHFYQRLTPREVEISDLVAKGLTNAEIATKLWITQNSVKQALKRMFRKLDVSSRTAMVAKLHDIF